MKTSLGFELLPKIGYILCAAHGGGMPDFNRYLAETKDHRNLINFLDVCNATCGEQTVKFFKFLSSPFLEFWSSSLILR